MLVRSQQQGPSGNLSNNLRDVRLARAELLDRGTRVRIEDELGSAVKRRLTHEARLAGALLALAPWSQELRARTEEVACLFVKRRAWGRPLLAACLRTMVDNGRGSELLHQALLDGDSTCLPLCAWDRDPQNAELLGRLSAAPSSVSMFSEAARVCRGEANGALLAELSTRAKESVRLAFIERLGYPLREAGVEAPLAICPALGVLRSAERHVGRWLVLAEVAVKAGDLTAQLEASARANSKGVQSARLAWTLAAWALSAPNAQAPLKLQPEVLARLSDRPSAAKDMSFLFRLGAARVPAARTMLEVLAATEEPTVDSIRALSMLAREYGSHVARKRLQMICRDSREDTKGIAVAALWDACCDFRAPQAILVDVAAAAEAREQASELVLSRSLSNVVWGALLRIHESRKKSNRLLTESTIRRLRTA
jgi:hypothetical protein